MIISPIYPNSISGRDNLLVYLGDLENFIYNNMILFPTNTLASIYAQLTEFDKLVLGKKNTTHQQVLLFQHHILLHSGYPLWIIGEDKLWCCLQGP